MVINILEDITSDLASRVLTQVSANKDKEIDVNIMSRGGDMMAGNAIRAALEMSPAKVTTKVFGVAASMAASISQSGDLRLIASDAIFQPHNGAGLLPGRATKENLAKTAETLEVMDAIMLQSFSKSNLTESALKDLLIEDKPISAQEALSMAFFDGSIEPVQAEAYLNIQLMSNENSLMAKLTAMKEMFTPKAVEEEVVVEDVPTTPAVDEVVDEESTAPTREEFDKLVGLVETLIEKMSPLDTPSVTEQVTAEVDSILKAYKTDDVMPQASAVGIVEEVVKKPEVGFIEARQKEIESKFK